MIEFIAHRIEEAFDDGGLKAGQDKYRAYFVKPNAKKLYGKYKADVDTILEIDGYADCIVDTL